jgi:hypothetical protein
MPMTKEFEAKIRARLHKAGVPFNAQKRGLHQMEAAGRTLRDYLMGDYKQDRVTGTGINVYGDRAATMCFPVFAKETVLLGDVVQYIYLRDLVDVLIDEGNGEYLAQLENCRALFVAMFQENGIECPYSPAERSRVQRFLIDRIDRGKRNYYQTCKRLQECDWWSTEFRTIAGNAVTEIEVRDQAERVTSAVTDYDAAKVGFPSIEAPRKLKFRGNNGD